MYEHFNLLDKHAMRVISSKKNHVKRSLFYITWVEQWKAISMIAQIIPWQKKLRRDKISTSKEQKSLLTKFLFQFLFSLFYIYQIS